LESTGSRDNRPEEDEPDPSKGGEDLRTLERIIGIDNSSSACFNSCLIELGNWMPIKLIFHDKSEEFSRDGKISSEALADGLLHLHEDEPTTAELMAQMIYEDFVKNR
jgi:hypothetical protein